MGVLNVTPDSFSDGGLCLHPEHAQEHARRMVAAGANWIDIGGVSSHPKAAPVSEQEELQRVLPVVRMLTSDLSVPLSIDTCSPAIARACLREGVQAINDVSGRFSAEMAALASSYRVPLVLTCNHLRIPRPPRGTPLLPSMLAFFRRRIHMLRAAGVETLWLDPGYGFGKTLAENLEVLRNLHALHVFDAPVLVCTSRKGSLGRITGERIPRERLGASVASSLFAMLHGAHIVRAHDVKALRQALHTWQTISDPHGTMTEVHI